MPNEIPAATRITLALRSDGRCELNRAHKACHANHRLKRARKDHSLTNLLHLCLRCHRWIHDHIDEAYESGWLLPGYADPHAADVLLATPYGAGLYRLDAQGGYLIAGWLDVGTTFVLEPAA